MRSKRTSLLAAFGSLPARCCLVTASRLIPSKLAETVSLPNEVRYVPGLSIWFATNTASWTVSTERSDPSGPNRDQGGLAMGGLIILCCKDPQQHTGHYVMIRAVSISATFHENSRPRDDSQSSHCFQNDTLNNRKSASSQSDTSLNIVEWSIPEHTGELIL
jgi:hypothetical protein